MHPPAAMGGREMVRQETQQSPETQDGLELHREGEELLSTGRLDEAVERFQQALQFHDRAETHNRLGVALARLGRTDEALAAFQRAVELGPEQPSAWTNLGNARQELGQLEAAREAYERALALDPDHPLAHHNLGALLRKQGRYDQAVRHLKQANRLERRRLREEARQRGDAGKNRMLLLILLVLILLIFLR